MAAQPALHHPTTAAPARGPGIPLDVSAFAGRHVSDLSVADLAAAATHAWERAARVALSQGHSVTVVRDGRLAERHPDGTVTDLDHGETPVPRC